MLLFSSSGVVGKTDVSPQLSFAKIYLPVYGFV
jgi:hypothetical protein